MSPEEIIVGLEKEIAVTGIREDGTMLDTTEMLLLSEALITMDPQRICREINQFDNPMGARTYLDSDTPARHRAEIATPECPDATTLALYDRATDEEICDRLCAISQNPRAYHLPRGHFFALKATTDWKGNWWGCHKNFRIPAALSDKTLLKLVPFEISKPIWAGQGGIGPRTSDAVNPNDGLCFIFSPRALAVRAFINDGTAFARPLIGTGRFKNSHDREGWKRLQMLDSDPLQSDITLFVETGVTILLLRLLATRGFPDSFPAFQHSQESYAIHEFQEIVRDVSLRKKVTVADGRSFTALELQQKHLELLQDNEAVVVCSEEDRKVLRRFERIITLLGEHPEKLGDEGNECWKKKGLIWRILERNRTDFTDCHLRTVPHKGKEITLWDYLLMWHHQATVLDKERGIWPKLVAAGGVPTLHTAEAVLQARTRPPKSRAAFRVAVFAYAKRHGIHAEMVGDSWSEMRFHHGAARFSKSDPTAAHNEEKIREAKREIRKLARRTLTPPS